MADRMVKVTLRGEIADFQAKMSAAAKSVAETADKMTAADKKSQQFRQGLTSVGDTAGKVGLVAAAGLGAIVVATANFDQAMSNVRAATHETTRNMDRLREAAIQAGADTAFSASEAAAGIENLAKAGVSTADILDGGLSGALDLAAAGEMGVADAAEVAATALTQFKLSGEDVPHVADLLAAAAGKAQGDVSDMSMALKQSGLVASQMGLSIEETTGTLAAFASAGLLGSDAGTSFRTMLLRMANPSKEAADLMKALGINAYDAQGQFVGMSDLAGQLQTAFQGQSQATRDAALATIFGSDAIRAASVLYSQGADGVADWTSKVDDSGYAAETAATRMDNLRGDVEKLMGSLETALIGSGEGSQGFLRSLVQGLDKAVDGFNHMPRAVQGTTTALLGITAVTGSSLWFGSRVVQSVANTREALENLGKAGAIAGKALKGLGIAAGGLVALEAAGAAVGALEAATDRALPGVEALTSSLLNLGDAQTAATLAKQVGDLGAAADRLDSGNMQGFVDSIYRLEASGGMLGGAITGLRGILTVTGGASGLSSGAKNFREMSAAVEATDEALAGIVASGGPERAEQAFLDLARAQGLTADEQKFLLSQMPQYKEALAGAANSAQLAGEGADTAADGFAAAGGAAGEAAEEVQSLKDAFEDLSGGFLTEREAARATRDSLRDIKDALKDYRDEHGSLAGAFKAGTKSGDQFSAMLDNLATDYQAQISATAELSGSEKRTMEVYRQSRRNLVEVATQLGMTKKEAKAYADQVLGTPEIVKTRFNADASQAYGVMAQLKQMQIPDKYFKVTAVYGSQGTYDTRPSAGGGRFATGGSIGGHSPNKRADNILIRATAGEFVHQVDAVDYYGERAMHAINQRRIPKSVLAGYAYGGKINGLPGYATGGAVRDPEILRLLIEIRDLRKDLARDGKKRLEGLDRRQAEAELASTIRQLRETRTQPARDKLEALSSALDGFSVSGVLGRDEVRNPTARGVRDEIGELRASIVEAGGEWTKRLKNMAASMVRNARDIDLHQRALTRETERREKLTVELGEQQQALESLRSTMTAFSQSVAGNFLGALPGAQTITVPGSVDPALQGRLGSAEARLAAIRNSPNADSVGLAAEASRLIPQIEAMRAEVERQAQPVEQVVSAHETLREQLQRETEDALAFADSLKSLSGLGLNKDLFGQLAASGDLGLASELAAGGTGAVSEINDLWNERAAAAAEVAAFATQTVYGEQQAILQAHIAATQAETKAANGDIKALQGETRVLGDRVEKVGDRLASVFQNRIESLEKAVASIPRETAEHKKKASR